MKKNFKSISGLLATVVLVSLNFSHAINDYGIVENNLHWKVLGQTLTADGTNSGEGDGSNDSLLPAVIKMVGEIGMPRHLK